MKIAKNLKRRVMALTAAAASTAAAAHGAGLEASADVEASAVVRPVNSTYIVEAGSSHLADTYLSPLKYTGWDAAFRYERMQAMKFSPQSWRQQLSIGVEVNGAENPARNADMYYASVSASWGMLHAWRLPCNLTVAAGGSAGVNAGVVYSSRNGNNPASAKADVTVNATGYVTWKTRLWRMPVMFRWQTAMPLTGVFFSPEYDELYYEISLGNRRGLVHGAWPGNYFRWDNLVVADLDFSATRLCVGFRSRIYSSEANHITTRIFSYAFVLGVTGDWLSLSPRKGVPDDTARIIYAY